MVLTRVPTPVIIAVPCRAGECEERGKKGLIVHLSSCLWREPLPGVCKASSSARSATFYKNSSSQPPGVSIAEKSRAILLFEVSPVPAPVSCSLRLSLHRGESRSSVVDVDKQKPVIISRSCLRLFRGPSDYELSIKAFAGYPRPSSLCNQIQDSTGEISSGPRQLPRFSFFFWPTGKDGWMLILILICSFCETHSPTLATTWACLFRSPRVWASKFLVLTAIHKI